MLNLVQHLKESNSYETLKQVQGDRSGLFTKPLYVGKDIYSNFLGLQIPPIIDDLEWVGLAVLSKK